MVNDTSLARTSVPVVWLGPTLVVLAAAIFWLSNLQSRLDGLERTGSPTATSALEQVTVLNDRVVRLDHDAAQISVNTNRLTTLESEVARLRKELDAVEARAVHP